MTDENQEEAQQIKAISSWSDLTDLILVKILTKLPSSSDCISLSQVCSSWRQAIRNSRVQVHLEPVLVQRTPKTHRIISRTGKSRLVDIPGTGSHTSIIGSFHGWLVVRDHTALTFFIVNPITTSRIDLPKLPLSPPFKMTSPFVVAADRNCHIVVALMTGYVLHYCRAGDGNWSAVNTDYRFDVWNGDLIAGEGKIYVLASNGKLGVVDLSSKNPAMNWLIRGAGDGPRQAQCLVETAGELFRYDRSANPAMVYRADLIRSMWVSAPEMHDRLCFRRRVVFYQFQLQHKRVHT